MLQTPPPAETKMTARGGDLLSGDERMVYEQQCDQVLCEAIAEFAGFDGVVDPEEWQLVERREELSVYKSVDTQSESTTDEQDKSERIWTRVIATGYIRGQVEDVTNGLYCESDRDVVAVESLLSGAIVLDGAALQVTERRGSHTPFRFAGIKWHSAQVAGGPRDILTYERMGMTLDVDSTEVAYHVVHCIQDHQDWFLTRSGRRKGVSMNSRRPHPYTICYLYRKVTDDLVQCYIVGEYSSKASAGSQRSMEELITERVLMVTNTIACSEAKKLSRLVEDCKDTPAKRSRVCLRCRQRKSVADPFRVCGICHKSVCKSCRIMKVLLDLNETTKHPETEAFCGKCLTRANVSTVPTAVSSARSQGSPADRVHRMDNDRHATENEGDGRRGRDRDRDNGSSRSRRHVSVPPSSHEFNYDELFKRGNGMTSMPVKSKSSKHTIREERSFDDMFDATGGMQSVPAMGNAAHHMSEDDASPQKRRHRISKDQLLSFAMRKLRLPGRTNSTNTTPAVSVDNSPSNSQDLYLATSNSNEAEKQYSRHVHRDNKFRAETEPIRKTTRHNSNKAAGKSRSPYLTASQPVAIEYKWRVGKGSGGDDISKISRSLDSVASGAIKRQPPPQRPVRNALSRTYSLDDPVSKHNFRNDLYTEI
ncbi:hypothetical protein Poli38472_010542 [Pythium oligandrum]|uniref:FYVE-type domain-containing protein n=1 Tax=Pythium oligandrum TaxID=41045 RepID=A0A8K1C395_PYTOL|nr:hypothetical protein Poli38472_010542 [Pythium oligandrum]|eukprot:TMW55660.1 hypothetical protein Poli38472_010542 [Pythium oligandrum]